MFSKIILKNNYIKIPNVVIFSLLLASYFFSTASASAQEISSTDTIFVTATRLQNNIYSLPISTVLISKSEITAKSLNDVSSALSNEAGIDIRNYSLVNGAASISLLGSTSQQVLVLLDGLPINSSSTGVPDLGLFTTHTLERIEIVKGPSSSLYGSNALGGVINLISHSPFDTLTSPAYNLQYGYGSYNTSKVFFIDHLKEINTILDFHRTKSDGIRTNDDIQTEGVGLVTGYLFNSSNNFRINFGYTSKELGVPGPLPDTSQHPLYGDATSFSRYDRQKDVFSIVKSSADFSIIPNWNISLNSHYLINKTDFLWINQWSSDTAIYTDRYNSKTFITNLINRYEFSSMSSIALGADFEKNYFDAFTQYPQDTSWNPNISNLGIFTEGSFDYQKYFHALASIRLDRSSGFGSFISPAIGVYSIITPYLKIRTHLGKAYRAPTINDLYWPISGNLNIKPENGTAYQLGIDFIPNPNFTISLTGFTRQTKNLINWLPDTSNIWRPSNIDSSTITGIEWNGKIKPFNNLQIGFNGTFQNAWQIKKEMIYYDWLTQITRFEYIQRKQAFIPELMLSANINYQTNFGTVISLTGNYTGSRLNYYTSYATLPELTIQTKEIPAHVIFSSHINQQISKHIKLIFKADNILNNQYAEQFGNSITDKNYPRPLRTIFIGIMIQN